VGVVVKNRQLARQVGVFIEDPPENSMASFNFTSIVLNEGTSFTFSFWVCITDEVVASTATSLKIRERMASAPAPYRDVDDLAKQIGRI
jgi:hypothetical protein